MPRRRTEASHYLDAYKLTVEKKRLQQELANLERRSDRVRQQIESLETQIQGSMTHAQQLRESDFLSNSAPEPRSIVYSPMRSATTADENGFDAITLDY